MSEPLPPLPGHKPPPPPPLALGGLPPLDPRDPLVPPREIPNRTAEARRVVARLRAIVADHQASAARLGLTMDHANLHKVIDALIAESHRLDPEPWLAHPDELVSYVLRALYEELLEEPSNILFTTQVSATVMRYDAMDADFWRECLRLLSDQLD